MAASAGQHVLFLDADLATPIEEVEKGLRCLESGREIAIGSRAIQGADIRRAQPWFRRVAKKVFEMSYRLLLGMRGFEDTQCGFKLFRGDVAHRLFAARTTERFVFDIEILYYAKRLGYRIAEFPVVWTDAPDSRTRVFVDMYRMFRDIVAIRLRGVPRDLIQEKG